MVKRLYSTFQLHLSTAALTSKSPNDNLFILRNSTDHLKSEGVWLVKCPPNPHDALVPSQQLTKLQAHACSSRAGEVAVEDRKFKVAFAYRESTSPAKDRGGALLKQEQTQTKQKVKDESFHGMANVNIVLF